MAAKFHADPAKLLETLKATVFKDARSNEELQALVIVANEYNLNPLTKEIYAFPAKGGGITPVISIDGWVNLANSHPQMDGMDFEWEHDGNGKLVSCTCIVHRKDRAHPIRVTEYLAECKRNTEPWKMEHRMLRHKALCQAVRIAFGYSGVYDEDEAQRINERDITPTNTALDFSAPVAEPTPEKPAAETSTGEGE
jgi:phage recombination protein Bet